MQANRVGSPSSRRRGLTDAFVRPQAHNERTLPDTFLSNAGSHADGICLVLFTIDSRSVLLFCMLLGLCHFAWRWLRYSSVKTCRRACVRHSNLGVHPRIERKPFYPFRNLIGSKTVQEVGRETVPAHLRTRSHEHRRRCWGLAPPADDGAGCSRRLGNVPGQLPLERRCRL